MDQRNNQSGHFTNEPHFGSVTPNTQYRGYKEEEGDPYGRLEMSRQSNQYGYRGNNPQHPEGFYNTESRQRGAQSGKQYHLGQPDQFQQHSMYGNTSRGGNQYSSSQYQGIQGASYPGGGQYTGSQYQSMPGNTYTGGNQYSGAHYQGMPDYSYQVGHGMQFQDMTGSVSANSGMQTQSFQQGGTMAAGQGQQKGPQYNDRDRVNDLLSSEKYLTEGYNISTFEATNPQLHNTLKNILNETHKNRESLYHAMEQRGWYKTEQADQQQISQAHNQFSNYKNQLPF